MDNCWQSECDQIAGFVPFNRLQNDMHLNEERRNYCIWIASIEHEDVPYDAFTFREKWAVCFDFTENLIWIINQNVNKQI